MTPSVLLLPIGGFRATQSRFVRTPDAPDRRLQAKPIFIGFSIGRSDRYGDHSAISLHG